MASSGGVMMTKKKNVVLILTDQERAAGAFESEGMAAFRAEHLVQHQRLAKGGVSFLQHRIASSACVPSRASIFTASPPWAHGIGQTDGFAKLAADRRMQAGARGGRTGDPGPPPRRRASTPYFGKWHLSHDEDEEEQRRHHEGLRPWFRRVDGSRGGADPRNSGLQRDKRSRRPSLSSTSEPSRGGSS